MSWLDQLSELERNAVQRLREIDNLIGPLVAERAELEQVVERLGLKSAGAGQTSAAPVRKAKPAAKPAAKRTPGTRRGRAMARPGQREQQLLQLVGRRPGITVPEVASELGVDPTGLYTIVRRLQGKGELRKEGRQLRPVKATDPVEASPVTV